MIQKSRVVVRTNNNWSRISSVHSKLSYVPPNKLDFLLAIEVAESQRMAKYSFLGVLYPQPVSSVHGHSLITKSASSHTCAGSLLLAQKPTDHSSSHIAGSRETYLFDTLNDASHDDLRARCKLSISSLHNQQ